MILFYETNIDDSDRLVIVYVPGGDRDLIAWSTRNIFEAIKLFYIITILVVISVHTLVKIHMYT